MKNLLFIVFLLVSLQVKSQSEIITTKLTLDEISKTLTETINTAMDRADYSVAKAAIQALSVLDAWKETNSKLLDQAFSSLDETSRNLFSRMESLSNEINSDFENHISNANELIVKANQITENLPLSSKRSFILDYSPKVIYPTENKEVIIELKGVNLDKAELKYQLKNGNYVLIDILGPTKAKFKLPISEIDFNPNKPSNILVQIEHKTRNGSFLGIIPKYKDVERKIFLSSLPLKSGKYLLTGTRTFEKEERKNYRADAGRFEAKNSNVWKIGKPLGEYKWDLRNGVESRKDFKVVTTGGGEKGRCQELKWNDSNEYGISIQARCDQIRELHRLRFKAGYIHCGVEGPIYRMVETTESINKVEGNLKWNIDKSISIPDDLTSFQLKITFYDGKERIITNDYSDGIIKVIKNNDNIIIRSIPPSN